MNNKYKIDIFSFTFFIIIAEILAILQSSAWIQFSNFSVTPQFWIILGAYASIHKNPVQSIPMIYIISLCCSSLTFMHFGKILLLQSIIFLLAWSMRGILNLKNAKMFILFCLSFTLALPLLDWFVSSSISTQKTNPYSPLNWILTSLITIPPAGLLHFAFTKFDRWMQQFKIPKEERAYKQIKI